MSLDRESGVGERLFTRIFTFFTVVASQFTFARYFIYQNMNRKTYIKKYSKLLIPLLLEELKELLCEEDKRLWARQWILRRSDRGTTYTLFRELEVEDPGEFRALLRMDIEHFNELLENIAPMIQREDTVMREAIPARIKLQVALSYLATGVSYRYLQAMYRVSRAAISVFIPEVMNAISTYLEKFLKVSEYSDTC